MRTADIDIRGLVFKPEWRAVDDIQPMSSADAATNHGGSQPAGDVLFVYPQAASRLVEQLKRAVPQPRKYEILLGEKTEIRSRHSWEINANDDRACPPPA